MRPDGRVIEMLLEHGELDGLVIAGLGLAHITEAGPVNTRSPRLLPIQRAARPRESSAAASDTASESPRCTVDSEPA